ncbi:MAG: LamG domain-containing protein [Verrucomicrobia bacterium]|nr:LamG domain-containing protein [Verrucomicrobiota bacterium]
MHRSRTAAGPLWLAALSTLSAATITFEEGIPEPGSVQIQYCSLAAFNRGVRFLEGGGQLVDLGAGTASPTHALVVRRTGDEHDQTKRLVIAFTAPQNEVSFRMGLDRAYPFSVVAFVSAYTTPEPVQGAGRVVADYVLDRGPTPIDQFLSVSASSIDGPIRCVVVEYLGDWGTTHAAYEVIDDLTFDNPGPQCGEDTIPPLVEITRPGFDGWPVYSPNLRLAFRAYDEGTSVDAGIARVRISLLDQHGTGLGDPAIVCGGDPSVCRTCPSCPKQQRRGEFLAWDEYWTTLLPGTRAIRVEAWDLVGNRGEAVRRINFSPAGTQANLWVGAVEVTQGIQTAVLEQPQPRLPQIPSVTQPTPPFGGTPPLVANRTTILRVYPRMVGSADAPDLWATARLFAFVEKDFGRLEPHPAVPVIDPRETMVRVVPGYDLDALRRGGGDRPEGGWEPATYDFKDAPAFAARLKAGSDPVSQFIASRLAPATQSELAAYSGVGSVPGPLLKALVDDLDQLVKGRGRFGQILPPLWDPVRFAGVALSPETRRLVAEAGNPLLSPKLNRLLLEDAYPREIALSQKGWVFVLAPEWVKAGRIVLRAEVNAGPETPESPGSIDGANSLWIYGLNFVETPRFTDRVLLQPIQRRVNGVPQPFLPFQFKATMDFFRRTLPVDETTVAARPTWRVFDDDPGKDWEDRQDDLMTGLQATFPSFFTVGRGLYRVDGAWWVGSICGLVDGAFGELNGFTSGSTHHAWACLRDPGTGVHEVGHTMGIAHCGPGTGGQFGTDHVQREDKGGGHEDDWPYPHGTIGPHFGFDILGLAVKPPFEGGCDGVDCISATHDVMSYGRPRWVSNRNWIRFYNWFTDSDLPYPRMPGLAAAGSVDARPTGLGLHSPDLPPTVYPRSLLVAGSQSSDGRWSLRPAFELDTPVTDAGIGQGTHVLELADDSGRVLVQRFFEPQPDRGDPVGGDALTNTPPRFSGLLPLIAGISSITLRQGDAVLAASTRDPIAPRVRLLSPTAAGFDGAPDHPRVRWVGERGGRGGPLTCLVQYSVRTNAQGQPVWHTIAAYVAGEELPVVLDALEGGDHVRVRVLASDGLNTAVAVSEPFAVPNHPPQVEIISRGGGDRMVLGERVVMRGTAMDLEDGLLEASALTWRSHLDGLLATGNTLEIGRLQPGVHEITLEARDAQGAVATATVTLEVLRAPNHQPVAAATGPASVRPGQSVLLDSSGSHDADGDALTYHWSLVRTPPGSTAHLVAADDFKVVFNADLPGEYAALLTVHDGRVGSFPTRLSVLVPAHPPNDAFADAELIAGPAGAVAGYNIDATTEPEEPTDVLAGRTVWWRWQSSQTTNAFFEVVDARLNALLSVYRGTGLSDLTWVATGGAGSPPVARRAEFRAEAGIIYWIRVGGERGAAGDFNLRWGTLAAMPGTVAWYLFDGDAQDASGHAHHGTVFGPTLAPDRFCRPNAAYRFTGARDQRIELTPTDAFNPRDAFTIALWAYPTDINGWHMLFTKWDDLARRFFIHFATAGGRLQFSVSSTGTDFGEGLTDPQILPLDAWTHCVAVANRHTGELKLYRNGQLAAARALPPFVFADLSQTGVCIGGKVDGNFSFQGTLDDVLFFDRALTDAEVGELFTAQLKFPGNTAIPTAVTDDFSGGLSALGWTVISNTPAYQVQVRPGDVRFTRAAGGGGGYQFIGLQPPFDVESDFDVQVDFREAQIKRVNGTPGNQIGLAALFGNQWFVVTRSDEAANPADNVHIWADPPARWFGTQQASALEGTLRIVRSGPRVAGFWNGTLLHSACYNTNRTALSFTLQNNGTSDATAVTFDNFRLSADRVIWLFTAPPLLAVEAADRGQIQLSWPAAAAGFSLQSTENLGAPGWSPVGSAPAVRDETNYVIQPVTGYARFYRLFRQP